MIDLTLSELKWLSESAEAIDALIDRYHVDITEADAIGEPELTSLIRRQEARIKELEQYRDQLLKARLT